MSSRGSLGDCVTFTKLEKCFQSATLGSSSRTFDRPFDLLTFLGIAQALKIRIFATSWDIDQAQIGDGGTAGISQTFVDKFSSLAFKRLGSSKRGGQQTERKMYEALIAEICVLGHDAIREHHFIHQIQGICWDVESDSERMLPVLAFEKTRHGDLERFMSHGAGIDMGVNDRLRLCAEVAIAVTDLHLNNIVHGDIKPSNVLIFEDYPQHYIARVADFGFSTWLGGASDLVYMPRSEHWVAPEWHHRGFVREDAFKMDVYSFGLLCMWLLCCYGSTFGPSKFFEYLDSEATVAPLAHKLVAERVCLSHRQKARLYQLFDECLAVDPAARCSSFELLRDILAPEMMFPNSVIETPEEYRKIFLRDFRVNRSVVSLYESHPLVRTHIANRLEVRVSNSSAPKIARQSAAFELSLCYTLGFGIDKDETKASALLKEAEMTPDHLLREIRLTQDLSLEATDQKRMYGKAMPPMRRIGTIDDLYYRKLGNLNSATSRLQQEVGDIESVFGPGHRIVLTLKSTLSKIYIIQEKWEMASELELQILEAASKTVSEEHPDMLATKASIAVILGKLGYWEDAELLESQVLIVCLVNLSIDESSTIKSMERLAAALGEQRKWERAERLAEQALRVREVVDGMQHSDTKNALKIISYIHGEKARFVEMKSNAVKNSQCSNELSLPKQPKWRKSFTDWQEEQKWELRNERIKLQAIKSNETELGSDHPLTLDIMSSLAILYRNQQRWKDAEKLAMEVVAAKKRNHAPLAILQKDMLYLASVYSAQGRWKKAEELQLQIIGLGPDAESRAVERLFLLSHLALTYSRLGRLGEAENLETEVMEGFIKHLEPDHHWTVCSMKRLSSIYTQQGKWKEAEVLALKVLDVRRSSDEADSLEILMGINNLVNVYMGQKRWSEAEELETPVLEKLKTMKGERNPKTLLTMYNLAQIWYAQEKYSVALALMFKVVRLSAAQLGSSHPTSTRRQTTLNTWLLAIDDNLVDAARLDGRETERSNSKDITKTLQRFTEPVEDNNFASTAVRIGEHMKSLFGREKIRSYVEGKVTAVARLRGAAKASTLREKTIVYINDKIKTYDFLKGGPEGMNEGNKLLSRLYRELLMEFLLE